MADQEGTLATTIGGQIVNLTGTRRKHEVWLVAQNLTAHVKTLPTYVAVGETTDTNGNFLIVCNLVENGTFRVLVDRIWLSSTTLAVEAGEEQTGYEVTLIDDKPALAPVPNENCTIVAGFVAKPTGSGHLVRLFASSATDPAGTPLKSGYTNNEEYYRLTHVPYNTTYKISIDGTWCSPSTLTVGTTYDVERHCITLP